MCPIIHITAPCPGTHFINMYEVLALPKNLHMLLSELGERVIPLKQDTILSLKDQTSVSSKKGEYK